MSCVSESGYFYIQLELKDKGTHSTDVNAQKCFKMCPRRSGSGERCSSRRLTLRVKLEINLKNINNNWPGFCFYSPQISPVSSIRPLQAGRI